MLFRSVLAALCVGLLLLDINVPLMLRYGTEKARWVSKLVIILACASTGALGALVNDAKTVAAAVLSLTLAGMLVLTIIATAVSILLSLKFYRENR